MSRVGIGTIVAHSLQRLANFNAPPLMTFSIHSNPAAAPTSVAPRSAVEQAASQEAGDGFGFRDLIDVINPLHHIPVVGSLYRKISGDVIAPAFRIAGGALYGGPLGAAFAAAGVMFNAVFGAPDSVNSASAQQSVASNHDRPSANRGGWMVAATRQVDDARNTEGRQLANNSNDSPVPPPRRGGWMVAAAYAMTDERQAALVASKINTVA